ncbi:nucleosome assembly protein 1;2-like [Malus sylvestris]|uniref:nucleosome assembly protein 1;2-like n=1 Tax=Malus sylvestris TaxID=3752 RepID=UPI0021AC1F40|nr:nucleosome assembly protein 1;2-like [Malus sylvestris]XP_050147666.1 nucleosome assembly protein 1;2-like [Malus sylvestris]
MLIPIKLSFSVCFRQLNLILSKLVHRDEDVKSKSSNNVEKPLHFVSYAAAAVVAMTAGLADPDDDDESVLIDEDDGDDLEGDADDEMEEDEDDNGDDCNGGGVPVEIVGYVMHELVAHIDLEQVPNAHTLDQ